MKEVRLAQKESRDRVPESIRLIGSETKGTYTSQEVRNACPGHKGPIITTDFIVDPEEKRQEIVADGTLVGFIHTSTNNGDIISIDHHDADTRMRRFVSSGNLAALYMRAFGESDAYPTNNPKWGEYPVVISHTDCDSIVAAAILSGRVDPKHWDRLGEAVIAADHTGKENIIADTLQEMQGLRDIDLSLATLNALLEGKPIQEEARKALEIREKKRAKARQFVVNKEADGIVRDPESGEILGKIEPLANGVYYVRVDTGSIPTEMLAAELPEASVIIEVTPHDGDDARRDIAYRAGQRFPEGGNIKNLQLREKYKIGGRWNAGSSKREGGNEVDEQGAERIVREIAELATPENLTA